MRCETGTQSVGVIGARGYVGRELVRLLDEHPVLQTTLAVSRELAGRRVASEYGVDTGGLLFSSSYTPANDECPDVVVLGLPNGHARSVVEEMEASDATPRVILDLSADFRFDESWVYGVPELHATRLRGAARIANPGCYATAMQLALAPVLARLDADPCCFGVSGYTGAGTSPSEKNDAETLAQGVLTYAPVGHTHEREVSRQLGRPVRFAPCVAGYPRGITLTALLELEHATDQDELLGLYEAHYVGAECVSVQRDGTPRVQHVVGTPGAIVGGVVVDEAAPKRAAVVCVLDNLLKGAASQAVQNINLALGLEHTTGLTP